MTHLVDPKAVQFECGKPKGKYDKIYRCFQNKGNGLLFRLVDDSDNTWSFYNDTKDTVMKIRARFGAYSKINVLGKARQVESTRDSKDSKPGEVEVTLEVEPGKTEPFISGLVNGFSIGFQTEAAQAQEDIIFENGKPAVTYNKIFKCFKNSGNGLLFRLVDSKAKKWYFYNDTLDYLMKVTCEFDNKRSVKLLGKAKATGTPSGNPDGVVVTLDIEPGYTEPFIEGDAGNYRLAFAAEAVDNDHPADRQSVAYLNGEPNWKLVDKNAKVYRCFKEDGNGLLFRFIDEENNQWAFYNDTVDLTMNVTVGFPIEEKDKVRGAAGSSTSEKKGKVEVVMQIPPLSTVVMLNGLPGNYEVAYAAESANRIAPEEAPRYRCGPPDSDFFPHDRVYRCFKDHTNGLMFRLVDEKRGRWGFYNDTADTSVTAKVSFGKDSTVKALGKTRTEQDPEKGLVYVLTVEPQQTVPFIEGDVTSYVFEFTANKKVRGGVAFTL